MNDTASKRVRCQYDLEFKADAVRLVTQGDQRASDVARQLGITTKMLNRWRAQLEEHSTPEQAFVGQGNDREAEIKRLKQRIATLEMERVTRVRRHLLRDASHWRFSVASGQ